MIDFFLNNSLTIMLAFGTLFNYYWLYHQRKVLQYKWYVAAILAVLHTILGVLAAKAFAVLETLDFSRAGGNSVFGVIFFLPLVYYLGAKYSGRRMADTFDIFTPCLLTSVMLARINCIISGCCIGMVIPGMNGVRWPVREIEVIFYVALILWIIYNDKRDRIHGMNYPIYLILYGVLRFVLELLRESEDILFSVFHVAHIWAVTAFVVGLVFALKLKKENEIANKI